MIIQWTNINALEAIWTGTGCIALTFFVVALRQYLRVWRAADPGVQKRATWQDLRHEVERIILQVAFLLAGIVAMATPPPVRAPIMFNGLVVGGAFLLAQCVLFASSIRDQQERRIVLAALHALRPMDDHTHRRSDD